MIHIDFDPASLKGEDRDWWVKWEKRAKAAVKRAIKAWEESHDSSKIKFTNEVWGDLNKWLRVRYFHNKCAYCETSNPQYWADAEHYRPKGGVAGEPPEAVEEGVAPPVAPPAACAQVSDDTGNLIPHPGYFWLAYDWRNLIPGCKNCNSGLDEPGKLCRFPVKRSHHLLTHLTPAQKSALKEAPLQSRLGADLYYLGSLDLDDAEGPLLLHPYRDRPEQHLSFEYGGVVEGTTSEGKKTIEVCNLRYEPLRIDRQKAQEDAVGKWALAYGALLQGHATPSAAWQAVWDDALKDVKEGTAAYSAAIMAYVKKAFPPPP